MGLSLFKKWLLVFVLILVGVAWGSSKVFTQANNVFDGWLEYRNEVEERKLLISKLQDKMGYGGLIHSFKNYVLRGQQKYLDDFRNHYMEMDVLLQRYKSLGGGEREEKALADIQVTAQQYAKAAIVVAELVRDGVEVSVIDRAVKIDDSKALAAIGTLRAILQKIGNAHQQHLEAVLADLKEALVISVSSIIVLLVLMGLQLRASVLKPLSDLAEALQHMVSGYMRVRVEVKRTDEVGKVSTAINQLAAMLLGLKDRVIYGGEKLDSASAELISFFQEVGEATSKINREAEQMASNSTQFVGKAETIAVNTTTMQRSVEQMAKAVAEVSRNADIVATAVSRSSATMRVLEQNVSDIAGQLSQLADSSGTLSTTLLSVAEQTKAANSLAAEAEQCGESTFFAMTKLGETASKIDRIVELIDGVAEQTSMLALNASIEAAAAGEAGRGFGVVAMEVKDLAQQTSQANAEIAQQIRMIQQQSDDALKYAQRMSVVIKQVANINRTVGEAVADQSRCSEALTSAAIEVATTAKHSSVQASDAYASLTQVVESTNNTAGLSRETAEQVRVINMRVVEISRDIGDSSSQVGQFDNNIHQIRSSITDVNNKIRKTRNSVQELNEMATGLQNAVGVIKD